MRLPSVYDQILRERDRQNKKYPEDRNLDPRVWFTILVEEVGEVSKDILEHKYDTMEDELVQVAAVAIAWLEDIEIQRQKESNEL